MNDEPNDDHAADDDLSRPDGTHGGVPRLTIALVLIVLYVIGFWAGFAWLVYRIVTALN